MLGEPQTLKESSARSFQANFVGLTSISSQASQAPRAYTGTVSSKNDKLPLAALETKDSSAAYTGTVSSKNDKLPLPAAETEDSSAANVDSDCIQLEESTHRGDAPTDIRQQ